MSVSAEQELSALLWRRYECPICSERATIRVFCGVGFGATLAGGWCACDAHAARAVEVAISALLKSHRHNPEARVVAYAVEADEHDCPKMQTRPLWSAHPRIVCSTCNDTHRMPLRDRVVQCTRCPSPCPRCRGNNTAYCRTTPCTCRCHRHEARYRRASA